MIGLFVIGGLAIMSRYLIFADSNIPMIVGLLGLMGGLIAATRWRCTLGTEGLWVAVGSIGSR